MVSKIRAWLWNNRRVLIITALLLAGLEMILLLPTLLGWWAIGLGVVMTLGVWWLSGFSRQIRRWIWPLSEVIWITAGGVGFLVFNLLTNWQFHAAALILGLVLFFVLSFYEYYFVNGSWPVKSFSILNFLDILASFFVGAGLLSAGDFYSVDLGWLMVLFFLQVVMVVNLRFWREQVTSTHKWLYIVLTGVVMEEVLWVIGSWHRGVYFKSFILTLVFYLFTDFIMHYSRGTLTVKVTMEYVGLVAIMLAAMFILDWLFVLQ